MPTVWFPPADMSGESLAQRVKELEAEVQKLRAQLNECGRTQLEHSMTTSPPPPGNSKKSKKGGKERPFDFSAHPRRHVAVRLAYLGWFYHGFAVQDNTDNTVEAKLFEALLKTRLIQSRETSNYHRCGRTDKGVSAFSQVGSWRFTFTLRVSWNNVHTFGNEKLPLLFYLYQSWYANRH